VESSDEYLVAYRESRGLADPGGYAKHMPRGALLGMAVLVDGFVAGRWRRSLTAGRTDIEVTTFAPLSPAERDALDAQAQRFAAFVALPLRLVVREQGSDEAGGPPPDGPA